MISYRYFTDARVGDEQFAEDLQGVGLFSVVRLDREQIVRQEIDFCACWRLKQLQVVAGELINAADDFIIGDEVPLRLNLLVKLIVLKRDLASQTISRLSEPVKVSAGDIDVLLLVSSRVRREILGLNRGNLRRPVDCELRDLRISGHDVLSGERWAILVASLADLETVDSTMPELLGLRGDLDCDLV